MCEYTQGTRHGCGHPRTRGLYFACAERLSGSGKCVFDPPPTKAIHESMCYDCEEVYAHTGIDLRIGRSKGKELHRCLVLPDTSETRASRREPAPKSECVQIYLKNLTDDCPESKPEQKDQKAI